MDLACLIEGLSAPTAYPYPVEVVEVRQTHISVVFLAGPFVYKVKKPVNPGFLDFSTRERRRHFCEEEVRLNRRLAAQVYLGVVPVVHAENGLRLEGRGEVVEWAVKMQRLPDEATLTERLQRGQVRTPLIQALAGRVASFHREAEGNERIAAFGRFKAVVCLLGDVLAQAVTQVGVTVSDTVLSRIRERVKDELDRLRPLIEKRAVLSGRGTVTAISTSTTSIISPTSRRPPTWSSSTALSSASGFVSSTRWPTRRSRSWT